MTAKKLKSYQNFMGHLMTVYILCLFIAFPLYTTDKYFHLIEDRTEFYMALTVAAAAISVAALLCCCFCGNDKYKKKKHIPEGKISVTDFVKGSVSVCDIFFLCFLAVIIISALYSENTLNAFTGDAGRHQGVLMWLCYFVTYFLVSRFYKPKRSHLEIFAIMGGLFCLWCVTDYAGVDIFGWIGLIKASQRGMFSSAFGNINTCTQMFSLYLAISCVLFMTDKKSKTGKEKVKHILNAILIICAACGLTAGQSDNAVIGMGIVFLLIPFFLVRTWNDIKNYFICAICCSAAFPVMRFITEFSPHPYAGYESGILLGISGKTAAGAITLGTLIFVCLCIVFILYMLFTRRKNMDAKISANIPLCWGCFCGVGALLAIFMLIDANFGSSPGKYGSFENFLVFGDEWGTFRGMIWKLSAEKFTALDWIEKLIGIGTENFGIVMKADYRDVMVNISGQVFDSPHNEFLQYLLTTGILGCAAYYGMLISGCVKGLRSNNTILKGPAIMIITYIAVSLVSISTPIAVPFIIACLGMTAGSKHRNAS